MKNWILAGVALLSLAAFARAGRPEQKPATVVRSCSLVCPTPAPAIEAPECNKTNSLFCYTSEVDALLREHEAVSRVWNRLEQLAAIRTRLAAERFEPAAIQMTVDGLGLRADFAGTARAVFAELRLAARQHEEELNQLAAGATAAGLGQAYEDQRFRARERLAAMLDENPLHQLFRERLDEWMTLVLSE
jgi:hypothetical protein